MNRGAFDIGANLTKNVAHVDRLKQYLYFAASKVDHEAATQNILHHGMEHHGRYLGDHHPLFSSGMGVYFLVG
jgi:hypothetical protein